MSGWWYLRRAIPWATLLACCGAALVAAGAVHRWPSTAVVLLPATLGCCAAAAAFVFDEPDTAVAAVTPRAAWRRTARMAVALVPLALWLGLVLLLPVAEGWWLAGTASVLVTAGVAGLATRWRAAAPGAVLAAVVGIAVFVPLVLGSVLGTEFLYPYDGLVGVVGTFWTVTAGLGTVACLGALLPGQTA